MHKASEDTEPRAGSVHAQGSDSEAVEGGSLSDEFGALLRAWSEGARQARLLAPILSHPKADPVLTLEQAELYTGLTGKTLKTDALAGKLATIRRSEGGHFRARLSDLNEYIDHQRRAATAAGKTNDIETIDWGA